MLILGIIAFGVVVGWLARTILGRHDLSWGKTILYGLIGSFAESSTHVRERRVGGDVILDVVTGVMPGDSAFASHGHLARVRILMDAD